MEAVRAANRKQAPVPAGATVLEPVGTAPGLVVAPPDGRERSDDRGAARPAARAPADVGDGASATGPAATRSRRDACYEQRTMRMFGMPESEIAETLRVAEREGVALAQIEITTCLKRGEVEVVTRYEPARRGLYDAFEAVVPSATPTRSSPTTAATVDEQVAAMLRRAGRTLHASPPPSRAPAGLLAARLTERPGSSRLPAGGIVAYSNDVKTRWPACPELIERHGAVSAEVARALAEGACARLGADIGIGMTGVAGPGGGTEEKPVGLVWLERGRRRGGEPISARGADQPGGRADMRERSTTVAMHLLRGAC